MRVSAINAIAAVLLFVSFFAGMTTLVVGVEAIRNAVRFGNPNGLWVSAGLLIMTVVSFRSFRWVVSLIEGEFTRLDEKR
ncbi:MAG: hypothetical protein UY09_C0007G0006 [Parcubacteria group bacterium GW2011_GWA2_47_8]|nr:MAG: hypothetical protein UY09_C0007G0006 [Parcubacteria group bacterium GW2011_GWA2_47_8]OHB19658.1 MAG: hypothetical protein A2666_03910 [Parcubacteria group bacterium RIFCSPHIGHO2_01_FULL_47_10b]